MSAICVFLSIPGPFIDDVEALEWQSWTPDRYDTIPANRAVVMVTTTEPDLADALTLFPQVQVLEKHQPNGLRTGLTRAYDEINDVYIISGTHDYTPQTAVLEAAIKSGNSIHDDDVIRLAGWEMRNYID